MKKTGKLALLPLALSLTACADEGFDTDEQWVSDTQNTVLTSPQVTISKTSTSDTEKTVVIAWPVVHGAKGYLLNVTDISNPAQPVAVVTDSLIDRCSVALVLPNEMNYEMSLLTVASESLGNKNPDAATVAKFDTYVPSVTIPAGAEISQWVAENLVDSEEEQGITLEAGQTYQLDGEADFRLNTMEFRGDKNNAPTILVGENGCFVTQGGLKIRDLNIDCSSCKKTGLLCLSAEPDDRVSTEALGYKQLGANQDGFVIQKTVAFQNCLIKGLHRSLLYGNDKNWSLCDFRVLDCIVQLASTDTRPVLNLTGASNGLIQKMTLQSTTFYNTERNDKECYFMRFSNSSNAQPKKIFGDANNFLEYTIDHCSFIRTNPKKDFANNMPNTQNGGKLWIEMTGCVFFDTYRVYQLLQSQWVKTTTDNYLSYSDFCEPQSTDYGPGGRTDQYGNFYTTLDETPEFDDAQLQPLDLTKANGGVNLAPKGLAAASKSGDTRWY